jgi:hypothetical protein
MWEMRTEIVVELAARNRLAAIVADRNNPQKHVWRAGIVLATADGLGTMAIMQQTRLFAISFKQCVAFR